MKVSRRHPISERDLQGVLEELHASSGVDLERVLTGLVEVAYVKDDDIERLLIKDGKVMAFERREGWFPTIHALLQLDEEEYGHVAVIDMGAVKPVASGADVMVPGIMEVRGEFGEGDGVVVVDERNRRPIAVGVALMGAREIKESERGRAVRNVHHVGDELWEARF
ncbi:PUA domain-containing protein [Methanopyrus sp.]